MRTPPTSNSPTMRGLTRLAARPIPHPTAAAAGPAASYSTFSGGGRGRGRGSGLPPPPPPCVPGQSDPRGDTDDAFLSPALGRGRGGSARSPLPSSPTLPPFSSFLPSSGRGRGVGPHEPKQPVFFARDREEATPPPSPAPPQFADPREEITPLPSTLAPSAAGSGRGKPLKPRPSLEPKSDVEVNRHIRPRPPPSQPRMGVEDAIRRARGGLARGGRAGGRGDRGRGWRGRGGRGRGRVDDAGEEFELYLGDKADGERLEKRLGEANMNKLVEGFEELSWKVLPSPADDAYLDALHTNNMIEYEPEYLMQFDTNPDIDEKPPMPLEEYLEKMKPFLMQYEGIQSQEEWEEIIKETMEKVPYMKELMDMYCGPDRVTAKQQNQELERVAKTLPENVPSSVKRFTDRALLSLQSNPGWGFDKKCQFMDKLVWEVSQHHKY